MMNSMEERKTARRNSFSKSFIRRLEERNPLNLGFKSQSAMEYLMTYGWAILIIAVVLGALFSLGVFNGSSFAPKAQPGSCQVFRPNGPGSNFDINLMGVCNGELPQYVAQFAGGYISYINITNNPMLNPASITVTFWAKSSQTSSEGFIGKGPQPGQVPSEFYLYGGIGHLQCVTPYPTSGWSGAAATTSWYFLVCTYNGSATKVYVNSNLAASSSGGNYIPLWSNNYNFVIGIHMCCGNYNGLLANVQIYNTSLLANEIQALYLEGIGGAPIDLQNLVGWWPLNGDANDYSGNGNNGQVYNVIYTSNWENGYTPP